jgi:hypothetical protein
MPGTPIHLYRGRRSPVSLLYIGLYVPGFLLDVTLLWLSTGRFLPARIIPFIIAAFGQRLSGPRTAENQQCNRCHGTNGGRYLM